MTRPDPLRPITMQDVRLYAGEGRLSAAAVLAGCNAELARRAAEMPVSLPALLDKVERLEATGGELLRLIRVPVDGSDTSYLTAAMEEMRAILTDQPA